MREENCHNYGISARSNAAELDLLRSHERQVSSHGIPPLVEVNLMLARDGILFKEERYYVRVAIYLEC